MEPDNTFTRRVCAVLLADVTGFSKLMGENDERTAHAVHRLQAIAQGIVSDANGRAEPVAGDALFATFDSVVAAVQAAIAIQRSVANERFEGQQLQIRIGVHLGDVLLRDGRAFGDAINIAARLEALARPGTICISDTVHRQVRNKFDEQFVDLGQQKLKNISDPVHAYLIVPNDAAQPPAPQRGLRWAIVAAALVATSVAAVIAVRQLAPTKPARAPQSEAVSPPARKSVAVLPFVNMSGDSSDEYLSDGMTEEIITALSKLSGLRVAARTSSFFFKGKNEDIEKIGQQLRVGTVLEGSLRKGGTKLRVTVQLINVNDGYHLWSETYDEDIADILAIESDVAQRVAGALKVTLLADEQERLQRRPTENQEAYDLYLQGRYYWNKFSEDGFRKATECFERAIDKDPRFAAAYAGLADAYSADVDMYFSPAQCMPKARDAAQRALAIDPDLAEAHTSLAMVEFSHDWNWAGAEQEFRRAIALKPDYAMAHDQYGWLLATTGREDEARAEFERASQLDPLDLVFIVDGSVPYIWGRRQYERALDQCGKALEMDPNFYWAHFVAAWTHVTAGDYAAAIAELQKARSLGDTPYIIGMLGYAHARAGEVREAEDVLHDLEQLSTQRYVTPMAQVQIVIGLGQKDRAFEWLDKMYQERSGFITFLKMEPVFDPLRSDPRFTELLKKVRLEP